MAAEHDVDLTPAISASHRPDVARDWAMVDWAATPLGAPATWPQSLRTINQAGLGSRFSMWWAWGPDLTFFCNDAYRRDTLGTKYPWALGKPASTVWAEIWPDIGPRIDVVLSTGVATWDEALLLFLERSGYVEESYHTFSYSPLTDDDGQIAGMLCVVSEDTERVISERQMQTLSRLGAESAIVRTEPEVFAALSRLLGEDQRSMPFTATYLLEEDGTARLACTSGIDAGHPAAPPVIVAGDRNPPWPVHTAGPDPVVVTGLGERFPALPTGDWADPPEQALLLPLRLQGHAERFGFLVVGLNRYRPLDDAYRGFLDLVAGQIAVSISSARAYEAERMRAEKLTELDRAKTAFFTNISHEFRTPLTLLLGPVEDALADTDHPLDGVQRERTELVHRNARRLLQLVNTLLDFSRLEAGRVEAKLEPTDLAIETSELASMFVSAAERVGLRLVVDCQPLPTVVDVDRDMWGKVVLNLLSNALKFTFEGVITVALRSDGDRAVLTVADTGTGIEPAEQSQLFQRFHRVAGARSRSHEGSGIGLALVAELVALHQGTISVESAPGRGTTFTVALPLATAADPARAAGARPTSHLPMEDDLRWLAPPEDAGPAGADEPGLPRILVADDNADMRDYIRRLLGGLYSVRAVSDGAAALALAVADPPDLVLTDVMMPHLDGFGLLAALRADPATSTVPVVMLSARAGEDGTVEGLEAGADDYLVKPFSARELVARIKANLELDRVRKVRSQLEHRQALLDQAQRLAQVGSWEFDVDSGAMTGSQEYFRLLGLSAADLAAGGVEAALALVHPDDIGSARQALARTAATGEPLSQQIRVLRSDGEVRSVRVFAELVTQDERSLIRGSMQDVTEQLAAQEAIAEAAIASEAAAREHRIAGELQRSLLPADTFASEHLQIAGCYRAGVAGTQVGGDWYDVVELGAGRAALVMGDVMGRGVRAAAVMGQLRSAVRAYARLDLAPADILEFLDLLVRDLGEDQIVTCVYAVYDPSDRTLTYANAGHVPPLLSVGGEVRRLVGASGPPLGTGLPGIVEETVVLPVGSLLGLYTDGLVERRDADLDAGIDALADEIARTTAVSPELVSAMVDRLCPDGLDDDVALLLVDVPADSARADAVRRRFSPVAESVAAARTFAVQALATWAVAPERSDDIVLLVSELVTNAIVYGRPPVEVRMRRTQRVVVLEVFDGATVLPRRQRPTAQDEHGRGLQLVSILADRWGTRPTRDGKAVWCTFGLPG